MSEIQDAAQIIRVSFEGAEIILKLGKANLDFVKGVCAVIKKMLDQEKLSGKTSVKQLLKSGGDLQVFKFQTEDLATVKKMADKYGILYSILPDLNKSDGMSEILFHSQAAPRIKSIMGQFRILRLRLWMIILRMRNRRNWKRRSGMNKKSPGCQKKRNTG